MTAADVLVAVAFLACALAFAVALGCALGWAVGRALSSTRALVVPLLGLARRKWHAYCHARTQTAEVSDDPAAVPRADQVTTLPQVSGTGHHPAPSAEATPAHSGRHARPAWLDAIDQALAPDVDAEDARQLWATSWADRPTGEAAR